MPVFTELLKDADEKVRMEAPEIFRVLGKRRPGFVRPYLEHISKTDEKRAERMHVRVRSKRRKRSEQMPVSRVL